jgi:hypothetical protein
MLPQIQNQMDEQMNDMENNNQGEEGAGLIDQMDNKSINI